MRAFKNKRVAWAALFILFQLVLAHIFSLLYYVQSGVYPKTLESIVFTVSYWFGHLGFLAFLLFLPFWPLSRLFAGSILGRALLVFIPTFALVLMVVDSFIYSQYRFHINFVVLDLFFNGKGQIISFSTGTWALAYGFLFLFWGGNFFVSQKIWQNLDRWTQKVVFKKVVIFYLILFLFSHVLHAYADARYISPVTRMAQVLPLSEPLKAKSFFSKLGLVDIEEYKKRKALKSSFSESELLYPLKPLNYKPRESSSAKPMNIIWLVVDSLRADMMTAEVMPNTFRLSRDSVVFKNHFSNSNSTRHGIFGLFYGLPGSYFSPALRSQTPPVFMQRLAEENYDFLIYSNAPLTKPEFDQTVFANVANLRKFSKAETVYGRDLEITRLFVDAIHARQSKKPFFSFLFFDAPHGYETPPDYKKPFGKPGDAINYLALNINSDPRPPRDVYRNSVHFVDSLIGQILQTLKAKDLFENTIILVTSDHGQEFNDTKLGYWGHNSNYSQYQTKVPLILYWPGVKPQEILNRTSSFDVSATFMQNHFGVENKISDFGTGFNLFDMADRKWILMGREGDYAIFQDDQIVVVSPTGDYEVLDQSYRPLDRSQMRTEYVQEALKEMSRFLAR
jgi:uncharacterized protein